MHRRGRPRLRRGPLLRQALRRDGAQGGSLRPKRNPGRRPKADERAGSFCRPIWRSARPPHRRTGASTREARETGLRVSELTVSRLLRRLGWTDKKDRWARASETSGQEHRPSGHSWPKKSTRRGRLSWTRWARTPRSSPPTPGHPTKEGVRCSVPRKRGKNTRLLLASVTAEGTGPCVAVVAVGTTAAAVFEACL